MVLSRHLLAPSVAHKGNFTWANQTFGNIFESDGRPMGNEVVDTITCTPAAGSSSNTCVIPVPAPGVALVFLNSETDNVGAPSTTFATTAFTRTRNTATIDQVALSTSNGRSGSSQRLGSTSPESNKNAADRLRLSVSLVGMVVGAAFLVSTWIVL